MQKRGAAQREGSCSHQRRRWRPLPAALARSSRAAGLAEHPRAAQAPAAQAELPRKVMWRSTLTSLPAVGRDR